MTRRDPGQQFEELWAVSTTRAASTRGWLEMTLEEKKAHSSRFRRAMERYGREKPDGARIDCGAFSSRPSSTEVG